MSKIPLFLVILTRYVFGVKLSSNIRDVCICIRFFCLFLCLCCLNFVDEIFSENVIKKITFFISCL
jgi:hypothetical protein